MNERKVSTMTHLNHLIVHENNIDRYFFNLLRLFAFLPYTQNNQRILATM